jgi:hypothetical protein
VLSKKDEPLEPKENVLAFGSSGVALPAPKSGANVRIELCSLSSVGDFDLDLEWSASLLEMLEIDTSAWEFTLNVGKGASGAAGNLNRPEGRSWTLSACNFSLWLLLWANVEPNMVDFVGLGETLGDLAWGVRFKGSGIG